MSSEEKEQNFSNEIKDNKNNSNNSNNKNEEIIADLDKISIKYELLKIEYERQKTDLEEKEKLLSDYNLTNLNDSKISSEEKINLVSINCLIYSLHIGYINLCPKLFG